MYPSVLDAVAARSGHFAFESGFHGDLWLDLDQLLVDARRTKEWADALAELAAECRPELVCGPLTGGAFLAQAMAAELGAGFVFSERFISHNNSVTYRIPPSLQAYCHNRRVLLVDDAINAGSAVCHTLTDLEACRGQVVGIASLLVLNKAASQIAEQAQVSLYALAKQECQLWPADQCPLCQLAIPLTRPPGI